MSTQFERGRIAGRWTEQQLLEAGWTSKAECLANDEETYREDVEELESLRAQHPEIAAQREEYLKGVIAGARESLAE